MPTKSIERKLPGTAGFKPEPENGAATITPPDEPRTALIEMPLGTIPPMANDRLLHVEVHLNRKQSRTIRQLAIGLRAAKETCTSATGRTRLVDTPSDVVRWVLEQAALSE